MSLPGKIEIKEGEIVQEDRLEPFQIHDEALVSMDDDPKPNPAITMGWYSYMGEQEKIIYGSYGDFSCIVGASKSMKTKLKMALVAGYIGGGSNHHFPEIQGQEQTGKWIIDIDTEQSKYHTKRMKKDICRIVGTSDYPKMVTFHLRRYSPAQRREFLEWIAYDSQYSGNIGLICVDGAADLIDDSNDLVSSQALTNLFMKITEDQDCHLITVLHKTKTGGKPTGHIGSSIMKKAETVAFVSRDEDDVVEVTPDYTRNYPFRPFKFKLDATFLPKDVDLINREETTNDDWLKEDDDEIL